MSDYKRFISYLYCYENGIKKNNIGYARIETRNSQCKITIHIKLLSLANKVLDTYLFYRKNNRIFGLSLCPLAVKNSVGDCQVVISSDKVLSSDLPFSMIGGIIIPISPNRLLGTEWDDNPIIPSVFETEETSSLSAADLEMAAPEIAVPEAAAYLPTETPVSEEQPAKLSAESSLPEEQPEKQSEEPPIEIAPPVKTKIKEQTEFQEEASPSLEAQTVPPTEVPVPDFLNTITNYLLIDPAYIDHLSAEYAGLKQNSFVLHGYSSYRHLILAKWLVSSQVSAAEASNDTEIEDLDVFYQLGVPGIYSSREKAIAEKFGFAEFKTTKGQPLKYGDFGYWLVPVTF